MHVRSSNYSKFARCNYLLLKKNEVFILKIDGVINFAENRSFWPTVGWFEAKDFSDPSTFSETAKSIKLLVVDE